MATADPSVEDSETPSAPEPPLKPPLPLPPPPPPPPPAVPPMSATLVVSKPVAPIFTKEGLQKIKEQQAAQKPKRSRKKDTTVPALTPALTPPDSAQETTATEPPAPKPRRGRPKATPTGTPKPAVSGKGKRKKKEEDYNAEYKPGRGQVSQAVKATLASIATSNIAKCSSAEVSATASEAGSDTGGATMEEANSVTVADPHHSRRKRRKKSPNDQAGLTVPPVNPKEVDDTVMEDLTTDEKTDARSQPPAEITPEVFDTATEEKDANPPAPLVNQQNFAKEQFPNLKPFHPFFAPGGLKKSQVKAIHPFFASGGLKKVTPAAQVTPEHEVNSVGFTSMRLSRTITPPPRDPKPMSIDTKHEGYPRSVLSPTSKAILKIPGLIDAPWPNSQQKHVRQLSPTPSVLDKKARARNIPYPKVRKLKDRRVEVSPAEYLLDTFAQSLSIDVCKKKLLEPSYHEDEYFRVSSTLRLPTRLVLTGSQLQDEVRKRTVARLPFPGPIYIPRQVREDSLSSAESGENERQKVHPALLWLYYYLHVMYTPFDVGGHEVQLWAQKYAPQNSADVLHVGREMEILRDWVSKLIVDTGTDVPGAKKKKKRKQKPKDGAGSVPGGKVGKRRKKKKRAKGDGLDDFLVETDEEKDEMDEITDPEDYDSSSALGVFGAQSKKSAMRTGDKNAAIWAQLGYAPNAGGFAAGGGENGRMVNAVVISGPHGCGKTAAIYAVAKEMGFQVFEVNPGTRRSGKDVLDQVGEMSKNHLVHQRKACAIDPIFFKQSKSKNKAKQIEEVLEKAQQTQSLILLEEVDLLFEEDKQFWATVIALMTQSKRPIVMTCNDESLLPLDDLSLHAILRLSPPPEDLTVDYCLLLAANEGHLLERQDVKKLYNALKGDLRAIITELNFWCQMGIGDRHAGLDWILQRFPVGCDLDEKGEMKRVVSKDTYIGGMGWIPREGEDDGISPADCPGRRVREEDLWKNAWEHWAVDIGADGAGAMRDMDSWNDGIQGLNGYESKHLTTQAFAVYVDALSDVDVYAGSGMRTIENPTLDPTQPPLSLAVQSDTLLGAPLIQTDLSPSSPTSASLLTSLSTTIRSLARSHLGSETNALLTPPFSLDPITTSTITKIISDRKQLAKETTPLPSSYVRSAFSHLSVSSTNVPSSDASTAGLGTGISTPSIHGPLPILAVEIAPYVRAIVRHDQQREEARIQASNLLSAGGMGASKGGVGKRSTRAARLAMEGGDRGAGRGRKERYFVRGNGRWMVATGGEGWGEVVKEVMARSEEWPVGDDGEESGGEGSGMQM